MKKRIATFLSLMLALSVFNSPIHANEPDNTTLNDDETNVMMRLMIKSV